MAIRIERNEAGNCINFHGSSNPVYFNSCLSAEIDPEFPDTINVINDIKTLTTDSIPQYEFYRMPFTDFIRADFTPFLTAADAVSYITENGNVAGNLNILSGYLGTLDASAGLDISTDVTNYTNGAWYYVTTEGDQILNPSLPAFTLKVDDIIRISKNPDDSSIGTWQHIPNINASVASIQSSNITSFDYHVDQLSTSSIETGSVVYPFKAIESALSVMTAGQSLNIKGSYVTLAPINIDKSIHIEGTFGAELKFFEFHKDNGNILYHNGSPSDKLIIKEIVFRNAGSFGIESENSEVFEVRKCKFFNCGWNGQGIHTAAPSSLTGILGYDSPKIDLKDHYDNSGNIGDGGAILLKECTKPLIRESRAEGNLRGIRLQDCGINGGGFVIENQSIGNLESGIYLAAGLTYYGCQNITVTINFSSYNANNGLLAIGGLNNKFSQNEVYKNWNAGACGWGSANYTLRDCGLYDNNRSKYNGIGNDGDAKAGIQLNESYDLLGTTITYNEDARFIAEILDTQVHYTGEGANDKKVGILISSSLNSLEYSEKNIIKIDDVGFIDQDIAIDLSEVDTTNLKVMLGDNSFVNIKEQNIKDPVLGYYSELPYSNHVTNVKELDIVVDTLKKFIALHEGVGGKVLNTYNINGLASIATTRGINIIQTGTKKIQLWDNILGNVYINGSLAGSNIQTMNDSVNAAFNMNLIQYKEFIESEVGVEGSGETATFFYIESPDGAFDYPLFKTKAEADTFDAANGGTGTGSSHTHTYDDDLSGTTWHMPDNGSVMNGTSAPVNGIYGTSTNVIWNIQPTDDDINYAATFNSITYNVQEGSNVNIPYKPAGDTATYNITNVPNGYADDGFNITGTAEDISNGYGQAIQHVINVTKVPSGDFPSAQGTITINVKADLAGNEFTVVDQGGAIKFTQDGGITTLDFNTVTFNAGSTYKFYVDGVTMDTNDIFDVVDVNGNSITGNDGLSMLGGSGAGYAGTYFQYIIPTDVEPGKFLTFTDGATSTSYSDVSLTIAGSTYTETVTGITLQGPTASQTGTNGANAGTFAWATIDDTLTAGQRLVLDGTFLKDLADEMSPGSSVDIGIKDTDFNSASVSGSSFINGFSLSISMNVNGGVQLYAGSGGYFNVAPSNLVASYSAFIEISTDGNSVRFGFTSDSSTDNAATTTYSDWNGAGKQDTGNQGYGITNAEIAIRFNNYSSASDFDANEIDWGHLYEVSIPVTQTTTTPWTKAVDFSGGSEYLSKANDWFGTNPLLMDKTSLVIAAPGTAGNTANASSSRPWATAIVFQSKNVTSNQHIWNSGEGAGSNDDNIYLRVAGVNGDLYFGWGRQGAVNEVLIGNIGGSANSTHWWGIYIASNGTRLSGSDATPANLAAAFDIRLMGSNDTIPWGAVHDVGTVARWSSSSSTTGARMDRTFEGAFTIGGRGSNRSFHGKVASMVITTLRLGVAMPDDDEIRLMITDPKEWENQYRDGKTVRKSLGPNDITYLPDNIYNGWGGTQIWTMGDGFFDTFSGGLRNEVYPSDTSYTKLVFNNMNSTDIPNITIPVLS